MSATATSETMSELPPKEMNGSGTRIVQGQNGLMLARSTNAKVWNNTFSYLSGVGLGLYRSSGNVIEHNRIDYLGPRTYPDLPVARAIRMAVQQFAQRSARFVSGRGLLQNRPEERGAHAHARFAQACQVLGNDARDVHLTVSSLCDNGRR